MKNILINKTSILVSLLLFSLFSCTEKEKTEDYKLVAQWADMSIYITKNTPANSPTYASRCLGYIGLTMYESVVHGYPEYNSLAGQLNDLETLPLPEKDQEYNWQISFNAAEAEIIRNIYNQTSDVNKAKIDSLEKYFENAIQVNNEVKERSKAYGKQIAQSIFKWSKTDGGHRAYLHNFDKERKFEPKPGSWKPPLYAQSFSHHPLHPYWGENRTFLKVNSEIEDPHFIPYDEKPGSPYYQQFVAVYQKEKSLSQAEKEAAIWWGDDPDETFTPPGHSFYLSNIVIKNKKPDLISSAQTFAMVGMSVSDAFRNCWKWKYQYFTERPNTFIPAHIDSNWVSFWPDPPFPAFPSGHAIQASAAATSLTQIYGDQFSFTDSSHVGRKRDEIRDVDFKARHFNSFWEVAEETANSRFYGGIHTPQDNIVGLENGRRIAENVAKLKWRK